MKNQKSMGNKGFSLVELIVVIAIMAVLVGVLAPQFIKYVEKSRESTDVQNAQEIITALEVALADDDYNVAGATVTFTDKITVKEETGTDAEEALTDAGISLSTKIKSSAYADGVTFKVVGSEVKAATDTDLAKAVGVSVVSETESESESQVDDGE